MAATSRLTFGSILGVVTNTADMISNTVNTVSEGIDIANNFVSSAKVDQSDRLKVHRATYRDRLKFEAASEIAERNMEIIAYIKQSDDHKEQYAEASAMLDDIFKDS